MTAFDLPHAAYEPKIGAPAIHVLPGECRVIRLPNVALTTLLGSCVAACIRDPRTGVGGINHFLLPEDEGRGGLGSARYGIHAMEALINEVLRHGAAKRDLEAKVFGGANVIDMSSGDTVGKRNALFVSEYLRAEGIAVAAADLEGARARRIYYFPDTGRARVLRLPESAARVAGARERRYRSRLSSLRAAGPVEPL